MRIILVSCLVFFSFFWGCSSKMERIEVPVSKEMAAEKDLVTVIVTRPPTPLMRIGFEVYDGDKKIGRLYQNSEIVWKRKPGYMKIRFDPAVTGWVKFASAATLGEGIKDAVTGKKTSGHPYTLYSLTYEGFLGSKGAYQYNCGISEEDGRTIWIKPMQRHSKEDLSALTAYLENDIMNRWEFRARTRVQDLLSDGNKQWRIPLNWFVGDQQKVVTLAEGMSMLEVHDLINFDIRSIRPVVLTVKPAGIPQPIRDKHSGKCLNLHKNIRINSVGLIYGYDETITIQGLYGKFVFNNEPCQLEAVKESVFKIQPIPWQ